MSTSPDGPDRRPPPAGDTPDTAGVGGPVLAARVTLGLAEIGGRSGAELAARVLPRPPRPLRPLPATPEWLSARAGRSFVWRRVEPWYRRGVAEQRANRELAEGAVRALIAAIATRVLEEIDLDDVADRIDVSRVVARVDLDEVVARVDLDRVVERLDLDAIVERVDLSRVARQVLEEVDLDAMIRESTSSVAEETLEALRAQGANADHLMGRIADRLRMRRGGPSPES